MLSPSETSLFDESEGRVVTRRHSVTANSNNNNEASTGESTSPYARANLQLPKKKKEYKTWRQTLKGLFKNGRAQTASGIPGENGARIIHLNNHPLNDEQNFLNNTVTTGKYSIFSFLPKFLYEEFSKYANIFFLFVSCIQVSSCIKKLMFMSNHI